MSSAPEPAVSMSQTQMDGHGLRPSGEDSVFRSIVIGLIAGTAEIGITYPLEYAKTKLQLQRIVKEGTARPALAKVGTIYYTGCSTMMVGNAMKTVVRFTAYDAITRALGEGADGTPSPPMVLLAGIFTGFCESAVLVPFESIKTTQIDSRKKIKPGFMRACQLIMSERGLGGFLQGAVPTLMRQGATSAVRFTTYNTLRQAAEGFLAPGDRLGAVGQVSVAIATGGAIVAATQPLDVIKTRMQSTRAAEEYGRRSLYCAYRIFTEEGVLKFWSGAIPRLTRITVTGPIMYAMYANTAKALELADPNRVVF
ncbi:mitochondrial tricarboxylate transporter [Dipodascopsis tothii]|uniref:mitochondrial tricarboxylate transporter n=1 Tax=Dipodascopsis tothii TaxID=44089 RepID=UPI0034CFB5C7